MILGRLLYSGRKLSMRHRCKDSALCDLFVVGSEVDVDKHCYEPMDRLLQRQRAIQETLAKRHLRNGTLVLYDITSSYFEGQNEDSEIVLFGYNRAVKA